MPPSPSHRPIFYSAFASGLAAAIWLLAVILRPPTAVPEAPNEAKEQVRRLQAARLPTVESSGQERVALEDFLAGRPFVLLENEQPRQFQLSLDEVYLPEAPVPRRWRKLEPQPDVGSLVAVAKTMAADTGAWPGLVIYPKGRADVEEHRRVLTAQWLVRHTDRPRALKAVDASGFDVVEEPSYAPGYIVVTARAGGPVEALRAAAKIQSNSAITAVSPMLLHQRENRSIPNDPLFSQQWHLQNTGQGGGKAGIDVGVRTVWETFRGEGIRIGIVDDGLDMAHPDLLPNIDTDNDYDWNDSPEDTDATADPFNGVGGDRHGTAVAGVAGARGDNQLGVTGVAPQAKLVGFRLIAGPITDSTEAQSVLRSNDVIQIKNNSWGSPNFRGEELGTVGPLMTAAMKAAATTGRGGRGTISVWASGNGRPYDQGNKDAHGNSIYCITVGGVGNTGVLAPYSEGGSHLTVVAPTSGAKRAIVSTDHRGAAGYNNSVTKGELPDADYTNGFGGTSAAAPAVSGVVALMLQANPQLGWRDVKEILLRSSTKLFPGDPNWVSRTGGANPILAPIQQNEKYGGGLVNAQAAVAMSTSWMNLGPMIQQSRTLSPQAQIPDNDTTGVTASFDFSGVTSMRVEHVTVKVNITHQFRGDVQITLRSPGGAVSNLAAKSVYDYGSNYSNWTFSSVRHWGESANGTWDLTCKDLTSSDSGLLRSATVTLFGSEATPVSLTAEPQPILVAEGDSAAFSVSTAGYGHVTHQWKKGKAAVGTSADTHHIASAKIADAGSYHVVVTNLTGTATSTSAPLGVLSRTVPPQTTNQGGITTLRAAGAGPGLTLQWFHDGDPLVNDGRVSGSQGAVLTIKNTQPADAGNYVCRATLPGALSPVETAPATLTVRLKPVVHAPSMEDGIVSGTVSYPFTAANGATRFTATGLPPGMKLNTATGVLSGTPNAANTYTIKVTATNAAGTSEPVEIKWTVEKLPEKAQGTFTGLVERSEPLNSGYGGRFNLVVSRTGMLTGNLTLGGKAHRLTGRLSATATDVNPTATLAIKRPAPQPPLDLQFTINLLTQAISGSVGDSASEPAVLAGWRNDWIATGYAGDYNAAFLVPEANFGRRELPQGSGCARLTVTNAGVLAWAGRLADGTALSCSMTLGPGGEVPLHGMLYTNTGSVQGWAEIRAENIDGYVDWIKTPEPLSSKKRSFKHGTPLHSLVLMGARYAKPVTVQANLGLPSGPDNARLTFMGGGLDADFEQLCHISATNTVTMPKAPDLNPRQAKMTLNAATGTITGSFTLRDDDPRDVTPPIAVLTRVASYYGLLITRPGFDRGIGHFNLAELPDSPGETVANTPLWPGDVTLEAAPNP